MVRTTWIVRGVGKLSGSLHDLSAPRPKHGRRARAPERMTLGLYVWMYVGKYVCSLKEVRRREQEGDRAQEHGEKKGLR